MENLYDLIQIMNRRLGLLNKNCCQINGTELSPILGHILYELNKQNKPSMQQMAETLGTDITTFSRQIQNLIKMGLVEKTPDSSDRRIYVLSLTQEGREILGETKNQMEDYLDDILSKMNTEEREMVKKAFHLFNDKMAQSPACCRPVSIKKMIAVKRF